VMTSSGAASCLEMPSHLSQWLSSIPLLRILDNGQAGMDWTPCVGHDLKIGLPFADFYLANGWFLGHDQSRLAKRRRALLESNSPRNSQLETHRNDEVAGAGWIRSCSVFELKAHRIDRSPHALKTHMGWFGRKIRQTVILALEFLWRTIAECRM